MNMFFIPLLATVIGGSATAATVGTAAATIGTTATLGTAATAATAATLAATAAKAKTSSLALGAAATATVAYGKGKKAGIREASEHYERMLSEEQLKRQQVIELIKRRDELNAQIFALTNS